MSGQSGLRGRQRTKEPSPASLAGFTGSVTRRGKGEETNRATLKTKPSRRTITQEIDPSRYTDIIYIHDRCHPHTGEVILSRGGGGITPIGAVSRAVTGVKIFDRLKMALTTVNFSP